LDQGSDISDSTKAGIFLFQERLLHEAAQLSFTLTETVKKVRRFASFKDPVIAL
jgi:hypothetical protein